LKIGVKGFFDFPDKYVCGQGAVPGPKLYEHSHIHLSHLMPGGGFMNAMNIHNTNAVQSDSETYTSNQTSSLRAASKAVRMQLTTEDVESFLKLLRDVENNDGLRVRKIERYSRLISNGNYETEERIEELADRLLDELL
jgi:anti-sigma28 factor (negative regulator of flagellin synthesis)